MLNYNPNMGPKDKNHCGSCTHMKCLGFDNLVYGCNRFCTMKNPISVGAVKDDRINITNTKLIEEVAEQYKEWHGDCKTCALASQCPSCSATAYEVGKESLKQKLQCGFTTAMVAARVYFSRRLKAEQRSYS